MSKLLKHLFSLHEDEITGKSKSSTRGKNLMLQLSALLATIGKASKYIVYTLIALAIVVLTLKGASMYYDYKNKKDIAEVTSNVTKDAETKIKVVEEVSRVNTDAIIKSTDVITESVNKKVSVDRIVDNFVRETEKSKTVTVVNDIPVVAKDQSTNIEKLVDPVSVSPVTKITPVSETIHKINAINALSDLMDNEISHLPVLV